MPAKKRAKRSATKASLPRSASLYVISAPNPGYEGFLMDGRVRFIDGKARITDALARQCTYRDGIENADVPFENAEALARFIMDQIGTDRGTPHRNYRITPPLPVLAQIPDEYNPNLGRSRRDRIRAQRVMPEAIPAGVPAGADPDRVWAGPRTQKEEVA